MCSTCVVWAKNELNFCGVCVFFFFPNNGIADEGRIRIAKRSIDIYDFKSTYPYRNGSWIDITKFGYFTGAAYILNGASCFTACFGRGSSGISFFFLVTFLSSVSSLKLIFNFFSKIFCISYYIWFEKKVFSSKMFHFFIKSFLKYFNLPIFVNNLL